jgi:hypothetical protein
VCGLLSSGMLLGQPVLVVTTGGNSIRSPHDAIMIDCSSLLSDDSDDSDGYDADMRVCLHPLLLSCSLHQIDIRPLRYHYFMS